MITFILYKEHTSACTIVVELIAYQFVNLTTLIIFTELELEHAHGTTTEVWLKAVAIRSI